MGTIFMPSIIIFKLQIKNVIFFVDIWAYKFKYFEFLKYIVTKIKITKTIKIETTKSQLYSITFYNNFRKQGENQWVNHAYIIIYILLDISTKNCQLLFNAIIY